MSSYFTFTGSSVSVPSPITAEVCAPERIPAVPQNAALMLMEGVVKGGYPVDISCQSTADLTSIGLPNDGYTGALMESGLSPAAVAHLEATVLETIDFTSSITDVLRPIEVAELVEILPALSLIEEANPTAPSTPSVMDMLENFGLGIGEENTHFVFDSSSFMIEGEEASEPNGESILLNGGEVTPSYTTVNASESSTPVSRCDLAQEETKETSSRGAVLPVRNLVEWDRPSTSSS